eukprot:2926102-Alexandrium_andersonii.AAC.1
MCLCIATRLPSASATAAPLRRLPRPSGAWPTGSSPTSNAPSEAPAANGAPRLLSSPPRPRAEWTPNDSE